MGLYITSDQYKSALITDPCKLGLFYLSAYRTCRPRRVSVDATSWRCIGVDAASFGYRVRGRNVLISGALLHVSS